MWKEVFHGFSHSVHESGRVFRLIKQYRVLCHSFRPIHCNCFIQRHVAMAVESAHKEPENEPVGTVKCSGHVHVPYASG
jgi:hypothetical protein